MPSVRVQFPLPVPTVPHAKNPLVLVPRPFVSVSKSASSLQPNYSSLTIRRINTIVQASMMGTFCLCFDVSPRLLPGIVSILACFFLEQEDGGAGVYIDTPERNENGGACRPL